MSNQTLSRRFGAAELTVPTDELFSAWLTQTLGKSVNVGRDVPSIGAVWPGEGGVNGGLGRKEDGTPGWLIVPPIPVGYFIISLFITFSPKSFVKTKKSTVLSLAILEIGSLIGGYGRILSPKTTQYPHPFSGDTLACSLSLV